MIANKALFGLIGVGTLAAAWFLLPKDSRIKKAISEGVKSRISGMGKKVTPAAVNH